MFIIDYFSPQNPEKQPEITKAANPQFTKETDAVAQESILGLIGAEICGWGGKAVEKIFASSADDILEECIESYDELKEKLVDGDKTKKKIKKGLPLLSKYIIGKLKNGELGICKKAVEQESELLEKVIEATLLRMLNNLADHTKGKGTDPKVDLDQMLSTLLKEAQESKGDATTAMMAILLPNGAADIRGVGYGLNHAIYRGLLYNIKGLPEELAAFSFGDKKIKNQAALEKEFKGDHVAEAAKGIGDISTIKTKEWVVDNIDWIVEQVANDENLDPVLKEMILAINENGEVSTLSKKLFENLFLEVFSKFSEHLKRKEAEDPELSARVIAKFMNITSRYLDKKSQEKGVDADKLFQELTDQIFEIVDINDETLKTPALLKGMKLSDTLREKVVPSVLKMVVDSYLDQKWIEHKIIEMAYNEEPDDGRHQPAEMPRSASSHPVSGHMQAEIHHSTTNMTRSIFKIFPYGLVKFSERVTSHLNKIFSIPKNIIPLPLRFFMGTFENPVKSKVVAQISDDVVERIKDWPLSRLFSEGMKYCVDYEMFKISDEEVPEHKPRETGQAVSHVLRKQLHDTVEKVLFGDPSVKKSDKGWAGKLFNIFIKTPLAYLGWVVFRILEPFFGLYLHIFSWRAVNNVRGSVDSDLAYKNLDEFGEKLFH